MEQERLEMVLISETYEEFGVLIFNLNLKGQNFFLQIQKFNPFKTNLRD